MILKIFFFLQNIFFQFLKKVDTVRPPNKNSTFAHSVDTIIFEDTRVRKYLLHSNTHLYYDDKISYVILEKIKWVFTNFFHFFPDNFAYDRK